MIRINFFAVLLLLSVLSFSFAQEETEPPAEAPKTAAPQTIKARDMEGLTLAALRKEFPRFPGMLASVHSCRLPDYGPLISVSIQLPAYYFTRPVLQELERRQKIAEEQTRKVRSQIEKAAQIISLRAREAGLVESLERENSAKRRNKENVSSLEKDLSEVRKMLDTLEEPEPETEAATLVKAESFTEVDLNKMLLANYQQMIEKVSQAMKEALAENGPKISDLELEERVGINAFIRDSFLGSQGRSIIFILDGEDIHAFRNGELDLQALKQKIVVKHEFRQ